MSFVNVFGGSPVQPADISFIPISLTGDLELSWPTQFQDTPDIVAQIINVTPSANGFTLTLPDATQVSVGQSILINNVSGTHTFGLLTNSGANLLNPFPALGVYYFYLTDNLTVDGVWSQVPWGTGSASFVTSVGAVATTAGLTITNTPITTSGNINFALSDNLVAVSNIATTGIQVVTDNAPSTWVSRTLVAGANMAITNADGVAGNPTIALGTSLSGLTSVTIGNIQVSGQTITTTNSNLGLQLGANGTGTISLLNDVNINNKTIFGVDVIRTNYLFSGNMTIANNSIASNNTNGVIWISPNGTGSTIIGPNPVSSPAFDSGGNLTQLTSLTSGVVNATTINVASMVLSTDTIATITNNNLNISPDGTGVVIFNSNLDINNKDITNATNITTNELLTQSINVQGNTMPIPRASVSFVGSSATIIASQNVTSVVRNSAGIYTVNFSYAFPTANYIPIVSTQANFTLLVLDPSYAMWYNPTTTSVEIYTSDGNDATISLSIFY